MDPVTLGALGFLLLVVLVVLGMHVFLAAALTGFIGLGLLKGWGVATSIAGILPHATASNYMFSVLPMFIIIGFPRPGFGHGA